MKTQMTYQDAQDFMNISTNAKLEHLLKFDVFYCEKKEYVLEFIPRISEAFWNYFGVNLSYSGYATAQDNEEIQELFFRTDKVITKDQLEEVFLFMEEEFITFFAASYKTMLVDDLEEVYEDLEYHWSIDSYQAFYDFTNEQMFDIFGKDAGLFSEPNL